METSQALPPSPEHDAYVAGEARPRRTLDRAVRTVVVPPQPFFADPPVRRVEPTVPALRRALAAAPFQERDIVCLGQSKIAVMLIDAYAGRAARARAASKTATTPERPLLRECAKRLVELHDYLATRLPVRQSDGQWNQAVSDALLANIRQAFAPALSALAALSEERRASIVAESCLYPEHPVDIGALAVLARLAQDLEGPQARIGNSYLERTREISADAAAQARLGTEYTKIAAASWRTLQEAGDPLRAQPIVRQLEEAMVAQDNAELQHVLEATVQSQRSAWKLAIRCTRKILDRLLVSRDLVDRLYGERLPYPALEAAAETHARLPELEKFSRHPRERCKLIAVWQFTHHLRASESRSSGLLINLLFLPVDVVEVLIIVRQELDAIDPPAHPKHAAQVAALRAQVQEQSYIAEAMYHDSVADGTLLNFVQYSVDKAVFVATNMEEARRLYKRASVLRSTLLQVARRDAETLAPDCAPTGDAPPPSPLQSETFETANTEITAASADATAPPPAAATLTPSPEETTAATTYPFATTFGKLRQSLPTRTGHHPRFKWRARLQTFTADERRLAERHFARASFHSCSDAAAYHFDKHGEPRQTLSGYIQQALRATEEFAGLLVPSLHDASLRLCAVDDDETYCVFLAGEVKRIVTYRNRAVLGR